jgi:hypothetical protein
LSGVLALHKDKELARVVFVFKAEQIFDVKMIELKHQANNNMLFSIITTGNPVL